MEEIYVGEQDYYSEYVSLSELMYYYDLEEANNKLMEIYSDNLDKEFPSGTV
jgi:hypothetical protein